jgi:uncharacterized protein (DUF58 family)
MIDLARLERLARRASLGVHVRGTAIAPGARRGARMPHGLAFAGHRPYQFGDDVRGIDWNVTARTGHVFVKSFRQAPAGTVVVLIDDSGSTRHGLRAGGVPPPVREAGALAALIAAHAGERVGLALFTERVEWRSEVARGRQHVLSAIRALERHAPRSTGTALAPCLTAVSRTVPAPATLVVVSDFIDRGFDDAVRRVRGRHHLVTDCVTPPNAVAAFGTGLVPIRDPESGRTRWIDARDPRLVAAVGQARQRFAIERRRRFRALRVAHVEVPAEGAWLKAAARIGVFL